MDHVDIIKKVIGTVIEDEKKRFKVTPIEIKKAIFEMANAYKPDSNWKINPECHTIKYDTPGHRCAYLHKYAMIHTGIVCDIMEQALYVHSIKSILNENDLTFCSLGSGPGTDILALLFFLEDKPKQRRAYLIDMSVRWSSVFASMINELRTTNYSVSTIASRRCFNYEYLQADLLGRIPDNVANRVRKADILTMIKFVSAAACKKTETMIKNIFLAMKHGAILLFIDNAAGGFYEIVEKIADSCGMRIVFGPSKHYDYEEKRFKTENYGSTSQFKAKVTAAVWEKIEIFQLQCTGIQNQSSITFQAQGSVIYDSIDGELTEQSSFEPIINKGIRPESEISLDEPSDIIKLHSKPNDEVHSGSCCLIM